MGNDRLSAVSCCGIQNEVAGWLSGPENSAFREVKRPRLG